MQMSSLLMSRFASQEATPEQFHVLLVDDDPSVTRVLRSMLIRLGFVVHETNSAADAIQLLTSLPRIDVAILDVYMPEMNGLDLLSIMKRAVYRDLPIIMMSGSSDHELVRQCFRGGAQDFMAKPVHRSDLESRLQSAFFEREQQRRDRTYRRWTTLTVDNISSHGDTSSSDSLQMDHYPAIVVSEHVDNHVEEGPNGIDIDSLRITDRDAAIEGHLEEVLELATDSDVER